MTNTKTRSTDTTARRYSYGTDLETLTTDPRLTAYERGAAAGNSGRSLDWNEATGEYNPFRPGTHDFAHYETGYGEAIEQLALMFPHS